MSYQIPQNLKYEEKIVFGLTLKQFGWIALFGILAAIVFLKTPLDFYVKSVIALVLVLLGFGFAFLDLFGHLKTIKNYFGSIRQVGYFDKKLEAFIEISEVKENALFLKDGSVRGILNITPLHFAILAPQEQLAIIAAYRDFLNSLDYNIQIAVLHDSEVFRVF
ncbi:MAG: PrgI family protein [Candidatus Micrarchaeota archaeon]